jgi:hypothetical protein
MLAAAVSRWPFSRRTRLRRSCTQPEPPQPCPENQAIPVQRVTLPLGHHLDVNVATRYLLHPLECDGWHVACRHEHQLVVLLTRSGVARYCVAYDCTPAVEKAICHGSRTWAMALIPLHGEDNLLAHKLTEIKSLSVN